MLPNCVPVSVFVLELRSWKSFTISENIHHLKDGSMMSSVINKWIVYIYHLFTKIHILISSKLNHIWNHLTLKSRWGWLRESWVVFKPQTLIKTLRIFWFLPFKITTGVNVQQQKQNELQKISQNRRLKTKVG